MTNLFLPHYRVVLWVTAHRDHGLVASVIRLPYCFAGYVVLFLHGRVIFSLFYTMLHPASVSGAPDVTRLKM